jgi:hypothetical protein
LQVDISILEDHAASSFRVNPEDRKHFLWNWYPNTRLHSVTNQKTTIWTVTTVKT